MRSLLAAILHLFKGDDVLRMGDIATFIFLRFLNILDIGDMIIHINRVNNFKLLDSVGWAMVNNTCNGASDRRPIMRSDIETIHMMDRRQINNDNPIINRSRGECWARLVKDQRVDFISYDSEAKRLQWA